MGGSVRTAAGVALAGRSHCPGRAITAADNISLNDCLLRSMIFGVSDITFTGLFQLTRAVFAGDAIHARGAKAGTIIFMKFDSAVRPLRRDRRLEVRIH